MNKKNIWKVAAGVLLSAPVMFIAAPIAVGMMLTHPRGKKTLNNPKDYLMEFEEIEFKSKLDNLFLRGWWIPSRTPSKKVVVTAHGYTDERSQKNINALSLIKSLHDEGYNVLMFDFRNSGKSEGRRTGVGFYEQHDLSSAVDYVTNEKHQQSVALLGWSMGAATSLVAGTNDDRVSVIIADSPFSDLYTYLKDNLSVWSKLPKKPFTPMILYSMERLLKINPNEVSPLLSVKNGHYTSFLIIHGKNDDKIPYRNALAIYDSIENHKHKELWLTEEAEHIASFIHYEEEYTEKVISFLKNHLN